MTTKELLQKGLEKLGPNGEFWIKGTRAEHSYVCAINALWESIDSDYAIRSASVNTTEFEAAAKEVSRAARALQKHLPEGVGAWISFYNDDPFTTFADIKVLYEKTIKSLEAA